MVEPVKVVYLTRCLFCKKEMKVLADRRAPGLTYRFCPCRDEDENNDVVRSGRHLRQSRRQDQ